MTFQEGWLAYAETGKVLGISAQAAHMRAKRRGWQRRTPNAYGDRAWVLVPDDMIVQPRSAIKRGTFAPHMIGDPDGVDQVNVRALETDVETHRDQLGIANRASTNC